MPDLLDLTLRLLLAVALGAVIGVEREVTDQPAGLRTHILVATGAALFAIIGAFGFEALAGDASSGVRVDVTRVVSQIVVGIGFLGGGVIIKSGASVRGLTTAASLWITAAVGSAVGIGMPALAAIVTAIVMITLIGLRPLRGVVRRYGASKEEISVDANEGQDLVRLLRELQDRGVQVREVHVDPESDNPDIRIRVRVPPDVSWPGAGRSGEESQHDVSGSGTRNGSP
jgi:putative Mg2+ transporter-C (MgtC) family protein